MENQELNLWLIKRLQTESALRSEEQGLESVRKEYTAERTKYQAARETFKSTKLRLLNEKDPAMNPALRFEADKAESKKLKNDRSVLDEINQRLSDVEGKLKKQSVLVLQSKKKLDVLEEKINYIRGRKIAKRNFKEELEILDSKIQQIVLTNSKLNKKIKSTKELEEIRDDDKTLSSEAEIAPFEDNMAIASDFFHLTRDSGQIHVINCANEDSSKHYSRENSKEHKETQHKPPNREFYEKLAELNEIGYQGEDYLTLRYHSKNGRAFELEITKDNNKSLSIEIRPHSSRDTFSLNAEKNEIINTLKEQGFKLNSIKIRKFAHDS